MSYTVFDCLVRSACPRPSQAARRCAPAACRAGVPRAHKCTCRRFLQASPIPGSGVELMMGECFIEMKVSEESANQSYRTPITVLQYSIPWYCTPKRLCRYVLCPLRSTTAIRSLSCGAQHHTHTYRLELCESGWGGGKGWGGSRVGGRSFCVAAQQGEGAKHIGQCTPS